MNKKRIRLCYVDFEPIIFYAGGFGMIPIAFIVWIVQWCFWRATKYYDYSNDRYFYLIYE